MKTRHRHPPGVAIGWVWEISESSLMGGLRQRTISFSSGQCIPKQVGICLGDGSKRKKQTKHLENTNLLLGSEGLLITGRAGLSDHSVLPPVPLAGCAEGTGGSRKRQFFFEWKAEGRRFLRTLLGGISVFCLQPFHLQSISLSN